MAVGLLSAPGVGPCELQGGKRFLECSPVTVDYLIVIVRILLSCNKLT